MSEDFNMDNCAGGERLLRVKEAAAMMAVSPRTVWRMIPEAQLKSVHIRGCVRVYLHSVEEYLTQSEQVGCV